MLKSGEFMKLAAILGVVILFFGFGCISVPEDTCPSISEEPVSGCRARIKCRQKKTSYGVGLGSSSQTEDSFREPPEPSPVTENYLDCINADLEKQKALNLINKDEEKVIKQ